MLYIEMKGGGAERQPRIEWLLKLKQRFVEARHQLRNKQNLRFNMK